MVNPPQYFEGGYSPVKHYYGDVVRQLFIAGAILMCVGAPYYADTLSAELPFEIVGAIVLIALAALSNPHGRGFITADSVAAGVGLLIYETWSLYRYEDSTWVQFFLRELISIIFLAAFYFSMKTLRAMILHTVGHGPQVGEFDDDGGAARAKQEHAAIDAAQHDEEENIVEVHHALSPRAQDDSDDTEEGAAPHHHI